MTSSCSDDLPGEIGQNPTMVDIFDQFYHFMDERYVFWDLENTDWDQMHQYRSQFERLDINDQQDLFSAVELFREMTQDILDHHFTIDFTARGIQGIQINPSFERKQFDDVPSYFDSLEEVEAMIRGEQHVGHYTNDSHFITGLTDDQTVIFKTNLFNFGRNYRSGISAESDESLDWFFDQVENDNIKHVILDLRSCTGGNLIDLNFFLGKLLIADIHFGYTKMKLGRGRTHYSPLLPAIVRSRRVNTTAPKITVLTNGITASLAELMAYIIQSNQLGTLEGASTYGATSPIAAIEIFNSGTYSIGEFMRIRTASVQFLDKNSRSIEGVGVAPN